MRHSFNSYYEFIGNILFPLIQKNPPIFGE
nr:MAG TPA: hypothetical protein [Caudoviricetes sp.]